MVRGEGEATQGLSEEVSLSRHLTEEGAAGQSLGQSFSGRGTANAEEVCLACWRNSEKAPVAKAE